MKPRHKKPKPKEIGMSGSIFSFLRKKDQDHSHQNGHNHSPAEPTNIPIYTIAIVLDGEVHEVLRAQDKLADLLLANSVLILVEESTGEARIGMEYVNGKFREKQ